MTGELTLTGQVLPIGGLKEKALAAQDAGIKRVIAPKLNEQDVDDIPEHLRKDIEFIFVERIEEVLEQALEPERRAERRAAASRGARRRPAATARRASACAHAGTARSRARVERAREVEPASRAACGRSRAPRQSSSRPAR